MGLATAVRFRDLGPLQVERAGKPVPIAGARLAAALSLLLIHADQVVGPDALAEAMWSGEASPRSPSTLDSHVWRLRKVLEPDRGRGAPASVLLREPAGYRLLASTEQVDSLRFVQLAGEARELLVGGQPERAVRRTEEALALWRGEAFAAVADEPWAAAAVARLRELRSQVEECRIEALLAVGDPQRALLDLESALAEEPLRERLWALRMLANHRCGRTDQALQVYQRARELLLDELGIEPGAELRELHQRILAEDPALAPAPRPQPPAPPRPAREVEIHLPTRLNRLVGRTAELDRIGALLAEHRLVTLVGAAGCGKTRLAIEVGRAGAPGFPDGIWAVDLTPAAGPEQVLSTLTSALGIALPGTGTTTDALRSFTRGRSMLLVLDNCEHVLDAVAELVDDLLVEGSELTVLTTSREPLDLGDEVVFPLAPLPLAPDDGAEQPVTPAVELFLERLAAMDAAAAADPATLPLAEAICRAVDGVPLAIELAAARARAYSMAEIAGQVDADPSALARIGRGPADHHRTVRHAIEQSYRTLGDEDAAVHRAVSVVPGPFTPGLAAHLAGLSTGDAQESLARLVHRSLVVPLGPGRAGGPSRFAQLATVRGHAAHTAHADTPALLDHRDRRALDLARAAPRLGGSDEPAWFGAMDDDLPTVRAALQRNLTERPTALGVGIAARLGLYWYYRGMMVEARLWQERAAAAGTGTGAEPLDRAIVNLMLGGSLIMSNRADLGVPHVRAAYAAALGTAAERSIEYGEALAVVAGAFFTSDQAALNREIAPRIRAIARAGADPALELFAELGELFEFAHDADPAAVVDAAERVYERAAGMGNTYAAWQTCGAGASAALAADDAAGAVAWTDRMVTQHLAADVGEGPMLLELRADAVALTGDAAAAVRLYAAAQAHHRRAGIRWPSRAVTTGLMERATEALDRVEFEQAWQAGAALTLAELGALQPALERS